jgi:ribosomal protein S18 acetylase RimI-like enzyme
MSVVDLRRATPDDAERVVQFWHEAGASMGPGDSAQHVRQAIENPAAQLIVAEAGQDIVGTLLGTFDGWRGNMYRLVVHPDRRREGIGRRLVKRIEQFFAEQGARRVTVLIEADRPWAVAFWSAVGYPFDPRIVRHVGEPGGGWGAGGLGREGREGLGG